MKLPLIDLIVFLVYMLAIVLFGASFFFRKRSSSDFVSGGGKLPSWAIGMSIFATFVSSISFLALPGSAYQGNWNGFVFSLSIPVAAVIAVKFFVPLYRRINHVSAYHFLETRFGPWARIYASVCYLLTQLVRMGAVMYLLALALNSLLGWSIPLIIVVTGLSVIVYAAMGGLEAVVWTDAVQGIILIAGALLCPLLIFFNMPEGPGQLFSIAGEAGKFSLGSFDWDFTRSTFWVVLFYGLFINLQNFGIDQNYVQRYISARTEKEAKKATWMGSLLYLPVSFVFFFIGTALFAYYQAQPALLPAELQGSAAADKIFPYFIVSELPAGLTGLLIASVFAAGMSTLSTSINSSATIILSDHVKKYVNPGLGERASMSVLGLASVGMGLLSILVALSLNGVSSALGAYWALASIFSGGMLGLFLLAYLGKKVRNIEAAIGVILGVLVIAWMSLSPVLFENGRPGFRSPFHANMTIVFGTLTIFLTGFILSKLFTSHAKRRLLCFILLPAASLWVLGCGGVRSVQQEKNSGKAMKVIFETDMGNDIDDALALDMLYKYADEGRVELLALSSNKNSPYSARFLDIMNTWYGYPGIPLGKVLDGADSEGDARNYAQAVCEYRKEGRPVFRESVKDPESIPGSMELYRKILSAQEDASVTIISVGFSTNLARLLESPPDRYSPLAGRELVRKKVRLLSVMAGNFRKERAQEYNVVRDPEAARRLFAEWPGEIVVSPFELGEAILYPGSSVENDFGWAGDHPLLVAYRAYLPMPYDRPTWDLTSVLYAVEGAGEYFGLSAPGTVTVDAEAYTHFSAGEGGRHRYLRASAEQAARIRARFVELITRPPRSKGTAGKGK